MTPDLGWSKSNHPNGMGEDEGRDSGTRISCRMRKWRPCPSPWNATCSCGPSSANSPGTLQDVVGLEEASGFVQRRRPEGRDQINEAYRSAVDVSRLSREQVADVLVDLKRRIRGDFSIISQDEKIVFGNNACPFAEKVIGRPAICMMTSNVSGVIAAENLGYSKVLLEETIAEGAPDCRVIVHLKSTPEVEAVEGREYFKG